ncbi:MAG: hypothetical protein KAJ10_15720, partial [Thermodesulfovibrionia bacterium]|nr:hypothetical protein [Thermodesulfovibrionia bacterium]
IAGCLIGYGYYQKTQNVAASLAICIISPFIINILASIILKLWHKAVNSDIPPSTISRLSGSAFSILWGGGYLAMMLILIAVSPLRFGWLEKAQNDVLGSKSYALINARVGDKIPDGFLDIKKMAGVLQNPAKFKKLESSEEFKTLKEDIHLKELLADEETADQIRDKDYGKLLSNPKMQAVFQNKELLKKILALNQRIAEESLEDEDGPKTLEIQPE